MSTIMREIAEPNPLLWNKQQYHCMGEMGWFDEIRVELINGEIIQMSPISSPHWKSVILTGAALRRIFNDTFTVAEQNAFDGGPRSEPLPDVAVYAGDVRDFAALPSHALLIVEISLTTLKFDRTRKARLYAAAGVADYWIVNLEERVLEVHRQPSTRTGLYADTQIFDAKARLSPLAAPDVNIAVAELLP